jgi:hypothetical protein
MTNYTSLELPDLYDLLAVYTVRYTEMLSKGTTRPAELEIFREMIEEFQVEIETRQMKENAGSGYIDGYMPAIA